LRCSRSSLFVAEVNVKSVNATDAFTWSNLSEAHSEILVNRVISWQILQEICRIDASDDDQHPFFAAASTVVDKLIRKQ
jgi:hypothetical protein